MRSVLEMAARQFLATEHIKNVLVGEWVPLHDEAGQPLPGIRGRIGVAGMTLDHHEFGIDLMEMQPGSAFPLHVHTGDHILVGLEGRVYVHVDGVNYVMDKGDTVFIPAEYPHGVKTIPEESEPATFLAIGHPHKHLSAPDRMRQV